MQAQARRRPARGAPAGGRRSAAGFAIADLVAVLACLILAAVLALLVGSSTNCGGLRDASPMRTLAQQKNLNDGAENYKMDHNFYPGQDDDTHYASYTGSQILAACLYDYDVTAANPEPIGKYAAYKGECLTTLNGRKNVLSDLFPKGKEMAFCYYVWRKTPSSGSGKGQFVEADNDAHTEGREGGEFAEFINDPRFGGTPYNKGRFLLTAPGRDRKYFTADDIKNW